MTDSYVQVAVDGNGKKVDMDLVSTEAGPSIYRQKAVLAGITAVLLNKIVEQNMMMLALQRATLAVLNSMNNTDVSEENFIDN